MSRASLAPAGRRQAALSAFLALVLAFTTLVSALCLFEFEDHDCSGDDCAICLVLEAAQAAMSTASAGVAPVAAVGAVLAALGLMAGVCASAARAVQTPVSLKVKLLI